MILAGSDTQRLGESHESAVAELLRRAGLEIIARNYRCKLGEIDLIATEHEAMHFVEVRYRRNDRYGSAADSVGITKQRKIKQTARHFLHCHPEYHSFYCQFDVVSVSGPNYPYAVEWIADAFS